jgi:hypothetical protein
VEVWGKTQPTPRGVGNPTPSKEWGRCVWVGRVEWGVCFWEKEKFSFFVSLSLFFSAALAFFSPSSSSPAENQKLSFSAPPFLQ